MEVNRSRAFRAIRDAERELNNALRSLGEEDYSGALKYLQECSEYAVKAVLVAYGLDYPKVHEVGRFLVENRRMFPAWFKSRVEAIGETADMLARDRPRFRYPYEYESEDLKVFAEKIKPAVEELFQDCKRLVEDLFK